MLSRSQHLLSALLRDLAEGHYPVGSMLPPENELAKVHQVSRATVRKALLEIQRSGMISRLRGAGTRVLSITPAKRSDGYSQYIETFEDVVQFADTTRRIVLSMTDRVADFDLARRLACRPGSRWLAITMVRVNGQDKTRIPVCWADLFVTDQYADLIRSNLPNYDGAAIALIESRHGRVAFQIQQTIRAAKLPEDVARILSAEPNTPALAITRLYLTVAQEPIISTFSLYPSDRFEYAVNLERNEML